jgi:hypothetical protein
MKKLSQIDEAALAFEMVEPGEVRVSPVDATLVTRTRNFHNFNLEPLEFFDHRHLRISNKEAPEKFVN